MRVPSWTGRTPARIEGALSGAVGADEDGALAFFDFEFHAAVNDEFAVGVVDVLERHDALAAAGRLGEAEGDGLGMGEGCLIFPCARFA